MKHYLGLSIIVYYLWDISKAKLNYASLIIYIYIYIYNSFIIYN